MSEPEPAPPETRPLEITDRIDRLCDQFEAALRSGKAASIEGLLAAVSESDRPELLQELVALEIEFRRSNGEAISFLQYYRRFPCAAKILDVLQNEWNLRDSSGFIAVRDPVKLDVNIDTIALPNAPRQKIKQFELLSILGHGGFGTVWRARDTLLQRDVAVKVPRKDRVIGMNMSLFLREARAAAKLRHPNIVAIHEVGEEDSSAFIVSDLVDGVSLRIWLETVRPSNTKSAMLVAKLATAAHHAHEHGVVHRDLKPSNILIDLRGEPHIADFGLAKRDAVEDSLAIDGQLVGTPAYMSPEQANGAHEAVDRRTDVYALGAILYELLTGQRAFSGEMSLMLNQIRHVPPQSPRKIKPEIPRELEAICLKCLAKAPAERYATAQDLANDLHRHIGGETLLGIPAAIPRRVHKWFRRNRRIVLTTLAVAVVASSLAVFFHSHFRPVVPSHMRQVEFNTVPSGCEITVVAIDPDTGEPDPTKIQDAVGVTQDLNSRTPLTMTLAPGDYLVVAVLKDGSSWFHEVLRHVPMTGELPIPTAAPHQSWGVVKGKEKGNKSHIVVAHEIRIPPPDVTTDMGFVDVTDRLQLPLLSTTSQAEPQRWHVPAFFVDLHEFSFRSARANFGGCLSILERDGKRFPSAAELYELAAVACPPQALNSGNDSGEASEPPCLLTRGKQITGLHSGNWEWTTTRPGGPFSGLAYSNRLPDLSILRMVGCGAMPATDDSNHSLSMTSFHWQSEHNIELPVSYRGVRSAKPRRKPEDFVKPVTQE